MEGILRLRPRYYRWHVDPGVEWVEKNTAYAGLNWEIPLSRVALVLVDVWDRHYLKDTEARAEVIIQEKLLPLLKAGRRAGLRIVHAPSPEQAREHPSRVRPVEAEERVGKREEDWPPPEFRRRSGSYERYAPPREPRDEEREQLRAVLKMHPEVQPEAGEVVVATGEELHCYCRQEGILFLLYAGFNTNACVLLRDYGTLEMGKRGYAILVVRDCTTGMESFETHDELGQTRGAILLLEMFGHYSISSEELIHGLPD